MKLIARTRAEKLKWLAAGPVELPGYDWGSPRERRITLFGTRFTLIIPEYDDTGRGFGEKICDFIENVFGIRLIGFNEAHKLLARAGRLNRDRGAPFRTVWGCSHYTHRCCSLRDLVRQFPRRRIT